MSSFQSRCAGTQMPSRFLWSVIRMRNHNSDINGKYYNRWQVHQKRNLTISSSGDDGHRHKSQSRPNARNLTNTGGIHIVSPSILQCHCRLQPSLNPHDRHQNKGPISIELSRLKSNVESVCIESQDWYDHDGILWPNPKEKTLGISIPAFLKSWDIFSRFYIYA
jgi:hypothetical protein